VSGEKRDSFWVGATDFCSEGEWRWCFRENGSLPVDRAAIPFLPKQPDNSDGIEHCGTIDLWTVQLKDLPCDAKIKPDATTLPFICEV